MRHAPRYQIKDLIAAGGMAEVYRGESAGIEGFCKKVAIKRVLPKLSANQDFINMFLDEARLCAYLSHAKCVQVFDIGQGAGSHFIVMEYVDGADLKAVLDHLNERQQLMSVPIACLIAMQVCEGLAYAHRATDHNGQSLEIVHRDISPHNVLMTRYGEVKLVDFGLAKASSHLTDEDEDIVKGKFGYLAPEIALRKGVDHRVDIFAAGILLWEMLAGRRLFLGDNDLETFKQVQAARIPDVREWRNDVSDDLIMVLAKALTKDREQRYQTADDFARDLAIVIARSGQAVTYLDIAALVQEAANARDRLKKPKKPKNAEGVIGELILDTLHDFSGDEIYDAPTPQPIHMPSLRPQSYEDPSAWGLDDDFNEVGEVAVPLPIAPGQVAVPASPRQTHQSIRPQSMRPQSVRPRRSRVPGTVPPPPRERVQSAPDDQGSTAGGPWWRRWFG
jgi:eukaryotic-like serine/threonine-protein kinase